MRIEDKLIVANVRINFFAGGGQVNGDDCGVQSVQLNKNTPRIKHPII